MNWIEIMGPAGIGKSTFLEEQKKFRKSRKDWLTSQEGIKEIVGKHIKKKGIQKLLQIYINQNIVDFKIPAVLKYLNTPNQDHFRYLTRYEDLAAPYLDWYMNDFKGMATEKMRRISLYKDLINELCLFDEYIPGQTIVMDEGPFNLHPSLDANQKLNFHCRPKLVVCCHLERGENLKRIRKREREGRLAVSQRGLNNDDLESLIIENHNLFLKKREYLITRDIPYVDIDLKSEIALPDVLTKFLAEGNRGRCGE